MPDIYQIIHAQLSMMKEHLNLLSEKPLVILVHPIGGKCHWYRHLSAALEKNFRLQQIESQVANENISVQWLATKYCKKIPLSKPFYLIGWSFGAYIAFEMAYWLQQHNQSVEKLFLIDQPAIDYNPAVTIRDNKMEEFSKWYFSRVPDKKDVIFENEKNLAELKNLLLTAIDQEQFSLYLQHYHAWRTYQPSGILNNEIELIMANSSIPLHHENLRVIADDFGWGRYCAKPINIYSLPGDHYSIFFQNNINGLLNLFRMIMV